MLLRRPPRGKARREKNRQPRFAPLALRVRARRRVMGRNGEAATPAAATIAAMQVVGSGTKVAAAKWGTAAP